MTAVDGSISGLPRHWLDGDGQHRVLPPTPEQQDWERAVTAEVRAEVAAALARRARQRDGTAEGQPTAGDRHDEALEAAVDTERIRHAPLHSVSFPTNKHAARN